MDIFIEYFECSCNGIFADKYGCSSGKYFECVFFGTSKQFNDLISNIGF